MRLQLQLETIPVWDGVKEGSECFLCSLMKKAEEDGVRYYLSSAVMTPEVRVEMNKHGFCPHHSAMLAQSGKPQSLALAMDTYYDENKINAYSDGVFRLNLPGVGFNNSNWPHIIKYIRIWLAAAMVAVPLAVFEGAMLPLEPETMILLERIMLILCLASLFIPLYIAAKKY